MLSIPSNKHIAYIKVSIIFGAWTPTIVQYTIIKEITKNPRTPHTLLEEIPELEVIIDIMYSFNEVIFIIDLFNYNEVYN